MESIRRFAVGRRVCSTSAAGASLTAFSAEHARRSASSRPISLSLLLAVVLAALPACEESLLDVPPVAEGGPQVVAVTSEQLVAQLGVRTITPIRVRVLDAGGRPIQSAVVKYGVLAGGGILSSDSTLTNDQGFTEVTFQPVAAGTAIVEARSERPDGIGRVRFTVLVLSDPAEAAVFELVGGTGQTGPAGSILADPLAVRVRNPDGFPVDSHPVTFTVQQVEGDSAGVASARGEAPAGQVTVLTDEGGVARAFLRLGTRAGTYSVIARATIGPQGAETTETLTFTATATALGPARLVIISGDNQTAIIDTLHEEDSPDFRGRPPNPLVLQAVDRFGAPVAGVVIQWRVSDGGGELSSTVTVTDASGFTENVLENVTEGRNSIVAFAAGTNTVEFVITGLVLDPPEAEGGG